MLRQALYKSSYSVPSASAGSRESVRLLSRCRGSTQWGDINRAQSALQRTLDPPKGIHWGGCPAQLGSGAPPRLIPRAPPSPHPCPSHNFSSSLPTLSARSRKQMALFILRLNNHPSLLVPVCKPKPNLPGSPIPSVDTSRCFWSKLLPLQKDDVR